LDGDQASDLINNRFAPSQISILQVFHPEGKQRTDGKIGLEIKDVVAQRET
jgi:hypothetical protein